jgi:hypothetical protein
MGDMPVGAHQMSQTEMRGGSYPGPEDIDTELEQVLPTVQGYANPGATINLRGVEANTDRNNGSPAKVTGITGPIIECDCP